MTSVHTSPKKKTEIVFEKLKIFSATIKRKASVLNYAGCKSVFDPLQRVAL